MHQLGVLDCALDIIIGLSGRYTNDWDNGIIGNYWDDYIGKDSDDNEIGDSPYYGISGIIGGQDNCPIWWDSPVLNIIEPLGTDELSVN